MAPDAPRRYRSSAGPLRATSLRLDEQTHEAVASVASSLGLSSNAVAAMAIGEWLQTSAPHRLAAREAEAEAARRAAADLIERLSGKDTPTP